MPHNKIFALILSLICTCIGACSTNSSTTHPSASTQKPLAQSLPALTIHLAGDSTVSQYAPTTVQEGWGMELKQFFNDKVTVDNQAQGGANVQSFKSSARWTNILNTLKPGDYVLIQFGANDSGTAHGPITPPNFAATYGQMTDEISAKGATALYVTPSAFYAWAPNGKEDNARLAPYAAAMYSEAKLKNVLVDDLNARGVEWLNSLGKTAAAPFYLPARGVPDKAHFVKTGATKMAQLVAQEIRRINSPLAAYLRPANDQPLTPLFNGHDLSGWKIPDTNTFWKAVDGVLVGDASTSTKDGDIFTEKSYQDVEFETEYRLGPQADSGIDLRNTIQVQVGVSSSLKIDKTGCIFQEHPSGGYVGTTSDISKMVKTADWNKLHFIAQGDNIKVWLNDQLVLDFNIAKYPDPGPIGLQLHNGPKNKVEFRNMTLRELH